MATTKKESKRAYIAKRQRRVKELYLGQGLEARDIAEALVADGTIETTDESLESAIRLVRADVALLRAEIDARRSDDSAVSGNEVDALERKLNRLRDAYAEQQVIASGEPDKDGNDAMIVTTFDTPNGPMTSVRPKWPPGVRQKAIKDKAILAEKIADLEIALAAKRAMEADGDGASDTETGGITIIESDKSIDELIAENLGSRSVN